MKHALEEIDFQPDQRMAQHWIESRRIGTVQLSGLEGNKGISYNAYIVPIEYTPSFPTNPQHVKSESFKILGLQRLRRHCRTFQAWRAGRHALHRLEVVLNISVASTASSNYQSVTTRTTAYQERGSAA